MKKQLQIKLIKGMALAMLSAPLLFTSCDKTQEFEISEVPFTVDASSTSITVGENIVYTDKSTNVSTREWSFGGGDITSSAAVSETVTYQDTGKFETSLKVDFTDGSSEDRMFFVSISPEVNADFFAKQTTVVFGSSVEFQNLTMHLNAANNRREGSLTADEELETWLWEFEGGIPATSTETNPVILYPETGEYKVKLTANRNYPKNTDVIERSAYIKVVDVAVISPEVTKVCNFGSDIRIEYIEPLSDVSEDDIPNFEVLLDGEASEIMSIEVNADKREELVITLVNPITEGQTVVVNYSPGNVGAESGSILAPIEGLNIENSVKTLFLGNMSFEDGALDEFPPDWGTWNPTQAINNNEKYKITDETAMNGTNSVKVSYDGSMDQWIFDNKSPANVIPGEMYQISYWAKASQDGVQHEVRTIESGWAAQNQFGFQALTTEWQQFVFTFEANDAGSQNRVIWTAVQASDQVFDIFLDDFRMYFLGCE